MPTGLTFADLRTAGGFIPDEHMARLPRPWRAAYAVLLAMPFVRNMGKLPRYRF